MEISERRKYLMRFALKAAREVVMGAYVESELGIAKAAEIIQREAVQPAVEQATKELKEALREIAQICSVVTPSTSVAARLVAESILAKYEAK